MSARQRRVAMFDSGLGGLTLLNALRRAVPDVDVVYAADTARVPYGDRALEEVGGFARQIISHLEQSEPDLLMIACGTSCSAFDILGAPRTSMPLLPVVDCGAQAAAAATKNARIGVIATAATIRSGIFERKIKRFAPLASVTSVSAPRLVPLIESGAWASDDARDAVTEYCKAFVAGGCDTVVLGCTHFPHLNASFRNALGPRVAIVDPALECARQAAAILERLGPGNGSLTFEISGNTDDFVRLAAQLSDLSQAQVRRVGFSDQVKQPEYN